MSFCPVCGVEGHHCHAPLEPARFCPECGRRMVVQITPTGWRATCSRHGTVTG